MSNINEEEPLTSNTRPATSAILTIRIIKSFPYRNVKNYILKDVNLKTLTAKDLFALIIEHINTTGALRPFRNVQYDTLKIYTHAHGSKTMNLVVNLEHDDDWVLNQDSDKVLFDYGIENETELSLFNRDAYEEFKANPEEKW